MRDCAASNPSAWTNTAGATATRLAEDQKAITEKNGCLTAGANHVDNVQSEFGK
jgi:cytochrome c551/c552